MIVSNRLIGAAGDLAENAQESLSVVIRPIASENTQRELGLQLRQAQGHLTKFTSANQARIEHVVRILHSVRLDTSHLHHLVSCVILRDTKTHWLTHSNSHSPTN